MKAKLSVYGCAALGVVDGDSFRAVGDVRPIVPDSTPDGFRPRVRLVYIDSPERGEDGWAAARSLLEEWLTTGHFNLICYGRDKYGRLLADAERGEGKLSDWLAERGVPRMSTEKLRALAVEGAPIAL